MKNLLEREELEVILKDVANNEKDVRLYKSDIDFGINLLLEEKADGFQIETEKAKTWIAETPDNFPQSNEEFKRLLEDAVQEGNLVETLKELKEKITLYRRKGTVCWVYGVIQVFLMTQRAGYSYDDETVKDYVRDIVATQERIERLNKLVDIL